MAFIKEKVPEKDWELYNSFDLTYSGKRLKADKYDTWVVDREREIYFTLLGGGAFEQPEVYAFIWRKQQLRVYITSYCLKSRYFTDKEGKRIINWNIEKIAAPASLKQYKEEFIEDLKEVIGVYLGHEYVIDNISNIYFIEGTDKIL